MNLHLGASNYPKYHGNVTVLTGEDILIDITSHYDLSNAVIFLKNGDKEYKMPYKRPLTIPRELVHAGKLFLVCELYDGLRLLKKWQADPLIFIERETSFDLEPWSEQIEKRLSAVEEKQKILI